MEVFVQNTKKCNVFFYLSGDAREQSVRRSASKQATRALQNGTKRGTQVFGAREFRFASIRESYQ